MIIASVALDSRSPSITAGVSKAGYAALHLLLPDVPPTSGIWIGSKWYSKFWLIPSAGFGKNMEPIHLNSLVDLFLKPP